VPGLKLPPPPRGKNYLVVLMDAELVDKAGRLEGPYEDELTAAIETAVGDFIRTRPVQIYLPPTSPSR
jgi:hypothetical protein